MTHTAADPAPPAPDHPAVTLLSGPCGNILPHLEEHRQGRSDLSHVPWLDPNPQARGDPDPRASWQACRQAALDILDPQEDPAVPLLAAALAYRPLREVYAPPHRETHHTQRHSHRRALLQPLGFRVTRNLEHALQALAQAIADGSSPGLLQALQHLRQADSAIRRERDLRYNAFNDSTWTRIRDDHLHGHESQAHNDLLSWSAIQAGYLALGHAFQAALTDLCPSTAHDLDQVCTQPAQASPNRAGPERLRAPAPSTTDQPIVHAFQTAVAALRDTPGGTPHSLEEHHRQASEELSQIMADPVARALNTPGTPGDQEGSRDQEATGPLHLVREQLAAALRQRDHSAFAQGTAQLANIHRHAGQSPPQQQQPPPNPPGTPPEHQPGGPPMRNTNPSTSRQHDTARPPPTATRRTA